MLINNTICKNEVIKFYDCISIFTILFAFLLSSVNFRNAYNNSYWDFVLQLKAIGLALVFARLVYAIIRIKYNIMELVISAIVLLYAIYLTYITINDIFLNSIDFLLYVLMIITYKDVNYMLIIKIVLFAFALSTIFTLFCCAAAFVRYTLLETSGRYRNYLGFDHPVLASMKCMFLISYYVYYMKYKVKSRDIVLLFILNLIVYYLTVTRSSFFCSLIIIIMIALLKHFKYLRRYRECYKYILYIVVFLVFFIWPIICVLYNSILTDLVFFKLFNKVVSGRIYWASEALSSYSVSILPRSIFFDKLEWVDSSIIAILIRYGIITYVLFAGLFFHFAYLINKKKDIIMAIVFIVLLFHSTFDQELLLFQYNYFIFIWSYNNTSHKYLYL